MLLLTCIALLTLFRVELAWSFSGTDTNVSVEVDEPAPFFRLPRTLIPYKYDLSINIPYPDRQWNESYFNFTGTVKIFIYCRQTTDTLIIHQKLSFVNVVELHHVNGSKVDGDMLSGSNVTADDSNQLLLLQLRDDLLFKKDNCYCVVLTFGSKIEIDPDSRAGVFAASYQDANKSTQYLILTLLEPDAARTLFPCFDEPDFKSEFEIAVTHPGTVLALSNEQDIQTIEAGDGLVQTRFLKTPKMSTYLVIIAVGPLVKGPVTYETLTGVMIVGWTIDRYVDQIALIGKQTRDAVDQVATYFSFDYPLTRLGYVVVPGLSYSVENFGLIVYGDNHALFDNPSNLVDKAHVDMLAAHEVAHQWIGNLVTVAEWREVWLQEGLTTFLEFKFFTNVFQQWLYDGSDRVRVSIRQFIIGTDVGNDDGLRRVAKQRSTWEHFNLFVYYKLRF